MPTVKRQMDTKGGEFYPTPAWATRALMREETFVGNIWEPACGNGAMAKVIKEFGYNVYAADLYDRGYGLTGVDFLTTEGPFDNVVTNPPYVMAGDFVAHATDHTIGKVCMFLRLAFLEGVERYHKIFSDNPPNRIWVFPNRVTLYPDGADKKGGSTIAYSWFVWDAREPVSHYGPNICWFDPSYKADLA